MEDLVKRFIYLIINAIAVAVLMVLVDKELVMPIIGVWILTELCMIFNKLECQ